MRKRALKRIRSTMEEPKHIAHLTKPILEKRTSGVKKNWWIVIALIGIFFLTLFLNTYFNLTSEVTINPEGEGFNKYYLSGPDPYYNLRLVKGTYETGKYPYYYEPDPILNYPLGARGGRAPLFNMMALGFSRILSPFMNEIDAIGYSMQFIPALYGALMVFIAYFIGKELFNRKAGLIAAFLIPIIPIHLGSGHGSAYSLFDHDSFNLVLFFLTFLFLIKSIKEEDSTKSMLYAILGGVPLAGLTMTWVEAQYLYTIIAIYAVVQMLFDIFTNKIEFRVFRTTSLILFSGYLISAPVIAFRPEGFVTTVPLYICIIIALFGLVYYSFGRFKIPWTLSFPTIVILAISGLGVIYFAKDLTQQFAFLAPLQTLSNVIFGVGIYGQKVSMTIAEASTYQISHTVMSFGPAIYWIGWGGLIYLIYYYYKNKIRREYLFIIILFITDIWLASIAGRFLNDMVPVIAILSGWIVWLFIEWIDYKQMLRNIRSAGGGFHGIRRGVKFLHVFGILFLAFILILPNVFVAFDASIPNVAKQKEDGTWTSLKAYMYCDENYRGAYGLGIVKEKYWQDAFEWLSKQDNNIEDPTKRPAFTSWWDYGFYASALSEHPTVADNFQDGIPVAANFHTAASESEAVLVWIVRLLEGVKTFNNGILPEATVQILKDHLGENNSAKIELWMNNYETSPSYNDPIGEEYDAENSMKYRVGQQYAINAAYHDIVKLLNNILDDEGITWLYHDLQISTGWSIRYYGVEGYDRQIFNIFAFLSDKSLLLVNGIADDYVEILYEGYRVNPSTGEKELGSDTTWTATEVINWDREDRKFNVITNTQQKHKDLYFETMFYRTYIGPAKGESPDKQEYDYQVPCIDMKHFYAEYFSDLSKYPYYDTGKAAVVIAKYYEGAYVNGTVTFLGTPVDATVVAQKNVTYYENFSSPIDHDKNTTTANGNFSLIAGAGARLQVLRNYPQDIRSFTIKNVTFNGEVGSELAPISDDDAMRKGSNYERFLNISIEPANLEGYIYIDNNDDESFNKSVDTSIQDVYIEIYDISNVSNLRTTTTNETGFYKISKLLPGFYYLRAIKDGYLLNEQLIELYEFNNYYNISERKHSSIEGKVYYDDESNTISDVVILLLYKRMDVLGGVEEEFLADDIETDANGRYIFSDLVPGEYKLQFQKELTYRKIEEVTLGENETLIQNVSLELTPVIVVGNTTYNGIGVKDINISFNPDISLENNTAVKDSIDSEDGGSYEIDLSPGFYNITVEERDGQILVYTYERYLELQVGEGRRTFDISLTKHSTNVSGFTSFEGKNIANIINIRFLPDKSVENNSAIYSVTVESDETGFYALELSPGSYNVSVSHEFTENEQNYTYIFSDKFVIDVVPSIKTYNIPMTKEVTD